MLHLAIADCMYCLSLPILARNLLHDLIWDLGLFACKATSGTVSFCLPQLRHGSNREDIMSLVIPPGRFGQKIILGLKSIEYLNDKNYKNF